jgi:predicted kinase
MFHGTLIVTRGLPGSGKSSYARKIANSLDIKALYATDDYWFRPDGKYDFNYDLILDAHRWNIERVKLACSTKYHRIIIDNVHSKWDHVYSYVEVAKYYGYKIIFLEPPTEWAFNVEECYARNSHGVPYSTILRMYHEWEDTDSFYDKVIISYGTIDWELAKFIKERI